MRTVCRQRIAGEDSDVSRESCIHWGKEKARSFLYQNVSGRVNPRILWGQDIMPTHTDILFVQGRSKYIIGRCGTWYVRNRSLVAGVFTEHSIPYWGKSSSTEYVALLLASAGRISLEGSIHFPSLPCGWSNTGTELSKYIWKCRGLLPSVLRV